MVLTQNNLEGNMMEFVYDMSDYSELWSQYYLGKVGGRYYIISTKRVKNGGDFAYLSTNFNDYYVLSPNDGFFKKERFSQNTLRSIYNLLNNHKKIYIDRNNKYHFCKGYDMPNQMKTESRGKFRILRDSENMLLSHEYNTEKQARVCAEEFAKKNPGAKYSVVEIKGSVTLNGIVWE